MQKEIQNSLKLAGLAFAALALQPALADPIGDGYEGHDDRGYGDVIGDEGKFDIHGMEVTHDGDSLTIVIDTAFAGKGDDKLFAGYTESGNGIGYGDLFLSSDGWNPYGAAPYEDDNAGNGEVWEYAFSVDDRWMAPGSGSGVLYQLNSGDNLDDLLMSGHFMNGAIYRTGQEVAVDRGGDVKVIEGNSSWNVNDNYLTFNIDLTGTSLLQSHEIGLRWQMTCANDVIEGEYTKVPEPGTMALLGLGLVGLGLARRRRS